MQSVKTSDGKDRIFALSHFVIAFIYAYCKLYFLKLKQLPQITKSSLFFWKFQSQKTVPYSYGIHHHFKFYHFQQFFLEVHKFKNSALSVHYHQQIQVQLINKRFHSCTERERERERERIGWQYCIVGQKDTKQRRPKQIPHSLCPFFLINKQPFAHIYITIIP